VVVLEEVVAGDFRWETVVKRRLLKEVVGEWGNFSKVFTRVF